MDADGHRWGKETTGLLTAGSQDLRPRGHCLSVSICVHLWLKSLSSFGFRAFGFRISRLSIAVSAACLPAATGMSAPWLPVPGTLLTRWAAEVNPTNAHPEYPRPQLVRPDWLNLNGLWDYAVTPTASPKPTNFDGKILVPFPIESALSGVQRRFDENSTLWYERHFRVPMDWAGRRVRLHFGAVDWAARVFINGQEAGEHRGGYDEFSFEITDRLKWTGDEEIRVAVTDPTEGDQPRGKQSRKPEGIFYTPTSGIWQTVWLEPVPRICVDAIAADPGCGCPCAASAGFLWQPCGDVTGGNPGVRGWPGGWPSDRPGESGVESAPGLPASVVAGGSLSLRFAHHLEKWRYRRGHRHQLFRHAQNRVAQG